MKDHPLIFLIVWISAFVVSLNAQGILTPADKQRYLDAHNYARRLVALGLAGRGNRTQPPAADMTYLEWDDSLGDIAQNDTSKCVYSHTKVKVPSKWKQVGQNIDRNANPDPGTITNEYFRELVFYRAMNNRSQDQFDDTTYPTGHYTQVVWNETNYLGCGATFCTNLSSYISFCNYGLAGNLVGAVPYTVGKACTRCKPDRPLCMEGLCTKKSTCDKLNAKCTCEVTCENGGVLDPDTCTCKCPAGWETFFCDRPCVDGYGWCSYNTPTTNNCTANLLYCPKLCNACAYRPPDTVAVNRDNVWSTNFTVPQFLQYNVFNNSNYAS